MAIMIMKKKVEEIEPMDTGVRVRRGAPQRYRGKEEAEAQKPKISATTPFKYVKLTKDKPMISATTPFKYVKLTKDKPMLSEEEVTKVSNIKNSARATRVLDRMKKRKGIGNSRMMD